MRIMIADDEVIIRTGLAEVIKWDELGLTLLTPAASAEEVLDRIAEEKPHILLTDIRMNGMSGLELAEHARVILPDLEIIILSGYDDFIYTQQAIRVHISDYLLKTSRPEEIIRTVLKVKQRVEARRASQSREHARRRDELNALLKRLVIDGETVGEEELEQLHRWSISIRSLSQEVGWQITVVYAEGWGSVRADHELLLFAVSNMAADLLPCISFSYKDNVIIIARTESGSSEKAYHQAMYEKIQQLLKCELRVIGGKVVSSIEEWHSSYTTAIAAARYMPLIARLHWEYADIEHRKGGQTVCSWEEERRLSAILLDDDLIALKTWVLQFIDKLLKDPETTPQTMEASIHSVALAAHRWLERIWSTMGKSSRPDIEIKPFNYNPEQLPHDNLFPYLFSIMKLYHSHYGADRPAYIDKAIVFIRERLGNELRLQQVADHVHLHPNHFSEVFKRELGMKFVDYVTKEKMEKAAAMLSSSPMKISDVAAHVGYDDVKYFSGLFKKHTGMTPSDYREQAAYRNGKNDTITKP